MGKPASKPNRRQAAVNATKKPPPLKRRQKRSTQAKASFSVASSKAKPIPKDKLTIMVSSTVYDSEAILDQIAIVLKQQYGYNVVMSKDGSVYVPIGVTNEQACLAAVKDCDIFFGIIFPRYGSGITHKEFLEAEKLNKPRFFVSHEKIEFIRKLLEPLMYDKGKRTAFDIPKTSVLDSIKVVDMYNAVKKNWVHTFSKPSDIMGFLETQFKDIEKRKFEVAKFKTK